MCWGLTLHRAAVSALRSNLLPRPQGTGAEIDVYSEPADIFQLHNRQMKQFNISQRPSAYTTMLSPLSTRDNLISRREQKKETEKGFPAHPIYLQLSSSSGQESLGRVKSIVPNGLTSLIIPLKY